MFRGGVSALVAGFCIALLSPRAGGDPVTDPLHQVDSVGQVERLPEYPGAHWVWVLDANLSSMPDGRAYLFDVDSGRSLGSLNTGYSFVAFALPPAYDEIYSAETYYSRHTRGVRTDVVTVYDPATLSPTAEIVLPPKRASTIPRLNDSALTDDGRFMAVFNLTPATSLSIVDTRAKRFVGEIAIPGCSLAFPAGAHTFFSPCFNGGVLVTELNPDGSLSMQTRVEKFFDAETDFIADNGVRLGSAWLFPSLNGNLHPLEVAGRTVKAGSVWSLLTEMERQESWRISGYQGSAVHAATGRLFVLMHRGSPDTYKEPGTEVWVFDIGTHTRLRRLVLAHPAVAIGVSQDADAVLVALDMLSSHLDVYAAADGRHLRSISEVGVTPALVQIPWQPPTAPEK
jgi:methylamine dehydrogenase heavy chain